MDELSSENLIIDLQPTRKRLVLPPEIVKNLDHVYRSNPYPSKSEYENLCKDMNLPFQRVKNWFCNRRRRDSKSGKICRMCRFFQAPINEQAHLQDTDRRPCISYWSLPTVAPPPIVLFSSSHAKSGCAPSSVANSKSQEIKWETNENMMTTPAENVVPSAFSLSVQNGTFTSEQSTAAPKVNVRYNDQQQYKIAHHPIDMAAANSWMMPTTGSPFWPLPLHNYCQTPDLQQVPLDFNLPPDWRSSHHPVPSYPLPYESYSQYMKTEKNGNYYDYDEINNN
ncbi:uncharacterized protein LOC130688293 [Daphnia carinata]|uniref:uncharacterized protein LOC130688293 n=1 Tax=Daphnia carinata TaxID=120202 RepID=UPI00257D098E|nr:uncharacterized protein LOC130688293 [Daphnia carinata]